MIEKKNIFKQDSQEIVEYYKAVCAFSYTKYPLFHENTKTMYHYFKLLSDYSLKDRQFTNHKQAVSLFYTHFFNSKNEEDNTILLNEKQLLSEVRKIRYKFKKNSILFYTYKYLFFAHYLLLRYGVVTEEDSIIQKIIQTKVLKINKKDALKIIGFTNALKFGDLESAKMLIQVKKFQFLSFFYESFKDYYSYQQTNEKRFLVIGTMSAGKSTFLNSIVGKDLFPSQNEACTSKLYKYKSRPFIDHFITSINEESSFSCLFDLNEKDLHSWNENENIKWVQLEGSLSNMCSVNTRVTFIDTPGTNNSMDHSHSDITMEVLKSDSYDTLIYLINATQLGTDDDKYLLGRVKEHLSNNKDEKIIFVVNKVDEIDESSGESIAKFVNNTKDYLEKNGFENPKVHFVSALAAKLSQMVLAEQPLTRKERNLFKFYYDFLSEDEADLTQYSNVNNKTAHEMDRAGQVTVENQIYDISRIYKVINHSGINQIINLI
ncbi:dynamin family protein [Bacillus sp. JJ722]|uniref:dynamin family protein n=1 Tax=Bacillus sp. JJ722 TaxID=3122973 RepID=UPI002FFE3D8B